MILEYLRRLLRRLAPRWLRRRMGNPTWGAGPPTILGICRKCGAVVLKGWHREVEGGYLCRRCAGGKGSDET